MVKQISSFNTNNGLGRSKLLRVRKGSERVRPSPDIVPVLISLPNPPRHPKILAIASPKPCQHRSQTRVKTHWNCPQSIPDWPKNRSETDSKPTQDRPPISINLTFCALICPFLSLCFKSIKVYQGSYLDLIWTTKDLFQPRFTSKNEVWGIRRLHRASKAHPRLSLCVLM